MRIVAVNATASRESGAVTILNQFIATLKENIGKNRYILFIPDTIDPKPIAGVNFVKINTKSWIDRIKWDNRGLKEWLVKNNINPAVIISFQNMGVNYDPGVPQIVYFHNQLTLERANWNPFKAEQRLYFLYKNIYPWFIKLHLSKVQMVIVQLQSIKEAFSRRFKYPLEKIEVIRPDIPQVEYSSVSEIFFNDQKIHFLYVATPLIYKNHLIIVKAVELLKKDGLADNIRIHFTCNADKSIPFVKEIFRKELSEYFVFEGIMPFDKVLIYYKSVDSLLFPSYIETFGLPLIEAASAGLPIICSDLPYAREVLKNYQGVEYINYKYPEKWAYAILKQIKKKKKHILLPNETASEWDRLFSLINTCDNA